MGLLYCVLAWLAAATLALDDDDYLSAHIKAVPLEPLREWLQNHAGIHPKFLSKTLAILENAEVVEVGDLRVLRDEAGFAGLFTATTAGKIKRALDLEPEPATPAHSEAIDWRFKALEARLDTCEQTISELRVDRRAGSVAAPPALPPSVPPPPLPPLRPPSFTASQGRRLDQPSSTPSSPSGTRPNVLGLTGSSSILAFNARTPGLTPFNCTGVGDGKLTCSGEVRALDFLTSNGESLRAVAKAEEVALAIPWTGDCTEAFCSLDLTSRMHTNFKGVLSGFEDGTYAYFGSGSRFNCLVGRVRLADFPAQVEYFDISSVLVETNCNDARFGSGFTDGRHAYWAERWAVEIIRVSVEDFSLSGVEVIHLALDYRPIEGLFTDGTYVYTVPGAHTTMPGNNGYVLRIPRANFSASAATVVDLAVVDPKLYGFSHGFTDGLHAYFVPRLNNPHLQCGHLARISLSDFSSSGVSFLDLTALNPNAKSFASGFLDGRGYAYLVSSQYGFLPTGINGIVARLNLSDFSASGVTFLDLAATSLYLGGFSGGFSDGSVRVHGSNSCFSLT